MLAWSASTELHAVVEPTFAAIRVSAMLAVVLLTRLVTARGRLRHCVRSSRDRRSARGGERERERLSALTKRGELPFPAGDNNCGINSRGQLRGGRNDFY